MNRHLASLSAAMRDGVDDGWLADNPCRKVRRQSDRQSGHKPRLAHHLHVFARRTVEQVTEDLDVSRGQAQRLIDTGREQFDGAMAESRKRREREWTLAREDG